MTKKTTKPERTDNLPPNLFVRDHLGLIQGINYEYKEDGSVNWLRMCPEKYLYLKPVAGKPEFVERRTKEIEEKYGKSFNEIKPLADNVDEHYLAITLSGLRRVAFLRGFSSLSFKTDVATPDYASVTCSISWLPNYETGFEPITVDANASVVPATVNQMTQHYLVETAANRAEARAIRNALLITAVSKEELGGTAAASMAPDDDVMPPKVSLKDLARKKVFALRDSGQFKNLSELQKAFNALGCNDFDEFKTFNDIPENLMYGFMGWIDKVTKQ